MQTADLFDNYESNGAFKVISNNYMALMGFRGGREPRSQKQYIINAIDEALKIKPECISGETVVIKVPAGCRFKIPYQYKALETIRRKINGIPINTNTERKIPMPSLKPKGKNPHDIIDEMQAEVDEYYRLRHDLKRDYEYYTGRGLRSATDKAVKWGAIRDKVMNKQITLKSLKDELNYIPSYRDLDKIVRDEWSEVDRMERYAQDIKNIIQRDFPSLYRKMFEALMVI